MKSLLFAGLMVGATPHAQAAGTRYALDPDQSRIEIHVGKSGVMSFAGHEHLVVAPLASGTARVGDPTDSSVDLRFASGALRVSTAGEPAGDAPKVQQTMLGPTCLDAARYPDIRFVSTSVQPVSDPKAEHAVQIQGRLTLHGVTREVPVRARVELAGGALAVSGTVRIRQTDFGIQPISKAGLVKVKDELTVEFRLQGRRAPGP